MVRCMICGDPYKDEKSKMTIYQGLCDYCQTVKWGLMDLHGEDNND